MSSYASSQKSGKEGRSRPLTRPPNVMASRSPCCANVPHPLILVLPLLLPTCAYPTHPHFQRIIDHCFLHLPPVFHRTLYRLAPSSPQNAIFGTSASSPPMSPADSLISFMLPQRPTDIKDLRRGNLSKLRRHLGQSVPADLVLPPIETDDDEDDDDDNDEYDSSETDSDDSHAKKRMGMAGLSFATLAELSQAISPLLPNPPDEASIKRQSRKWLREKKGKRWEEDDYEGILQSLRTLR
ncbi:hypothetical protein BV25DRAFT_1840565 [Artomyces pyxidatus]|uniref:Uncharacterized protein n=1 Tax=Artomyces pyxidatus TaxID=48021 RepID=A0ACB8SRF8_9AGAM|nr:hypothetical protein BV25DRAFT_1840565 [Artomyces pyxidatus]